MNPPPAKAQGRIGDFFGGLAAVLVAFPSAIAFGILVYSPLGAGHAAAGALAGIIGAVALGLVAPSMGGTPRLISAPCAPAAAVLSTLVAQLSAANAAGPAAVPILLMIVTLGAGLLQLLFGLAGGGRIIKYIPFPVVEGYLSSVGILILLSQLPKFLGLSKGITLAVGLLSPSAWNLPAMAVGAAAVAVMLAAPKLTRVVPAPILALCAGIAVYFGFAALRPELATLSGNPLVIGAIDSAGGGRLLNAFVERWASVSAIDVKSLQLLVVPALTLSVLLSIDTLKTCIIVDAITRSRHNSNRELTGQGMANAFSAALGGMAGSGTMGATLVNLSSGGRTRLSGMLEGVFALAVFLLLGRFVAWVPLAALAGILLVVAFRMIAWHNLHLLRQRSTVLDFVVIAAVIFTAVAANLIAAAGVGLGLAILLFLREQIRGSIVRRKAFGNQAFSKKRRLPAHAALLEEKGGQTVIFELQGALFFGTTDQLFSQIEPHLRTCRYIILDFRRIQAVDFTATHMLEQIAMQVSENKGCLMLADLPSSLPTGRDLRAYFDQVGLVQPQKNIMAFPELDDALEWTEDRTIEEALLEAGEDDAPLEIPQIDVFEGLPDDTLAAIASCASERVFNSGEKIFSQSEKNDEIFFIRQGNVQIVLPLGGGKTHHLATFSKGDFFGDMSFLDKDIRSADAVAASQCRLYVISRSQFDRIAEQHPKLGTLFFSRLARAIGIRLRQTDKELRAFEEA